MKAWGSRERVLTALVVAVYVGFGFGIDGFASPYAMADSTTNMSEKSLIAMTMALLIIAGAIELSTARLPWRWARARG